MGRTIAEKILSEHSGKDLKANDIAICSVDFSFGHDRTSTFIIDSFKKLGGQGIFDKTKFVMVIDHSSPSPSIGVAGTHKAMRQFASEKDIKVLDIGEGICHQLIPERGFVTCGDLVLGADSHACTYGALNLLSSGVGPSDLAITLASGKNWFKVPESMRMIVSGKIPKGIYAKDIILYIVGKIGSKGATYKSVEFTGDAISELSVEGRLTVANMSVEMGAKFGVMEADKKLLKWLKTHSVKTPNTVYPDKDAIYSDTREFDISSLSPQVSIPHAVDTVMPVDSVGDVKIDQGFIGTCTNGRLEDLEIASKILKNKKIAPRTKLMIGPASKGIYVEAVKRGYIDVFVDAGATVLVPGCGPCVGMHNGVPADGENILSTANRNTKGRMGNPNANIYLASPATVAASCLYGKIKDPREFKKVL